VHPSTFTGSRSWSSHGTGSGSRSGSGPIPSPSHQASSSRCSVLVKTEHVGVWAFHGHILTRAERAEGAEGAKGMFGMVTAFIVQES
jgi:hypothetical protein